MAKQDIQKETLKLQQKQIDLQIKNSEIMANAINKGFPLLKEYFEKKLRHVEGPKIRWSIIGFLGILFVIVIGTGILVFFDKLDSGSFTFLLGTLIGGTITFLGDLLLPRD